MSSERRRKVSDIVLKIGDRNKKIHGVSEQTTCSDVINLFLRKMNYFKDKENAYSYAIFESGNSSERMLSDNTKVLKTVRSWGAESSYHFRLKAAKHARKIFKTRESKAKNTNRLGISSRTEKPDTSAIFVQSQKTRSGGRNATDHVTKKYCHELVSNVDPKKMAGFLFFCGTESATETARLSKITDYSAKQDKNIKSSGFVIGKEIKSVDKINNIKYATKKVLKPKRVTVTQVHARMAKKHTFIDCGVRNIPSHSTPIRSGAQPNLNQHQQLADDITANISRMHEREAKEVILRKYFEDYLCYNSPSGRPFPMPERERGDGADSSFMIGNPDKGDMTFSPNSPAAICKTRARRHSDSDSGQEDDYHLNNLDDAFMYRSVKCTKHVHNETRFAHVKAMPRQLVSYGVTMTTQMDRLVDYSFSSTESNENITDIFERNVFDEDDEMASFMNSKLHDNFSDEGLSSLGSDDDIETLV